MDKYAFTRHWLLLPIAFTLLLLFPRTCLTAGQTDFEGGLALLADKRFAVKAEGAEIISRSGDPRAGKVLQGLLDGQLFFTKAGEEAVLGTPAGDKWNASEILTGKNLGEMDSGQLVKVTINNQLRSQLKSLLARLGLVDPVPAVRLAAVRAMYGDLSTDSVKLLGELRETEKDGEVQDALAAALALADLRSDDPATRAKALDALAGSLEPAVRSEVALLLEREKDEKVLRAARHTLKSIDQRLAWYSRLETAFFGLSMGSVLVLAAIGLAITFGVIGAINMAHGELIMIGAYTAYVLQQLLPGNIGLAIVLAVPAAFCVSGLVGIAIERSIIRFLYGRPLETLLATFGLSLILQQAVRTIFSPLNRSVATPEWMSGSIVINPVLSLTSNRVVIFLFAMLVFAALFLLMQKTGLGLQVRAVAQNRGMARAMGVRAARVDALTFGLGSGIAGIAGVALSQLTNVGPNLGQSYIVDSFMVVVFGGVGNLWGTLLGGSRWGWPTNFWSRGAGRCSPRSSSSC